MTYKKLQTTFERELIFEIVMNLRKGTLSYEGSKRIAKAFMPVIKNQTAEDFIKSLMVLCRYFPEITDAFIKAYGEFEKEDTALTLNVVRDELKGGDKYYGNN